MRNRDHMNYQRGIQTQHKLQLITFTGWSINNKPVPESQRYVPIEHIGPKQRLKLNYVMYNKPDKNIYLPFNTQTKRKQQWNTYPLYHLTPGRHYATWCINTVDDNGIDKSGDWFWYRTIELNDTQADNLFKYKMTLPDKDEPLDKRLVELIAACGYPVGQHIYELGMQLYGDSIKNYEWVLVKEKYIKDQVNSYEELLTNQLLSF